MYFQQYFTISVRLSKMFLTNFLLISSEHEVTSVEWKV